MSSSFSFVFSHRYVSREQVMTVPDATCLRLRTMKNDWSIIGTDHPTPGSDNKLWCNKDHVSVIWITSHDKHSIQHCSFNLPSPFASVFYV